MIDWAAVQWAVQGTRMRLGPEERRVVVRQLHNRMLAPGDRTTDLLPGQLSSQDVAERIGSTREAVTALRYRLPAASEAVCPMCRGPVWVVDATGVVEEHATGLLEQCPMSGRSL